MKTVCATVLGALITGTVLGSITHIPLAIPTGACIVFLILTLWKRWFLYTLIAALSMVNTSLHTALDVQTSYDCTFSGTVVGEDPYEHYTKLVMSIDTVAVRGYAVPVPVLVDFFTREKGIFLGRRLSVRGTIKNSKQPSRPNILTGTIIRRDARSTVPGTILCGIRYYIDTTLRKILRPEYHEVGIGLVIGGSGRISADMRDVFGRAGVLHILAVSGLHVGYVCMFIAAALFFIPCAPRLKFIIIMCILCAYTCITGLQPSVCRATLMACLFGLSLALQRNVDAFHIVNISALILLVLNPLLVFNVGAQLSYAAVYGIILLYPRIHSFITRNVRHRYVRYVLAMAALSFSAQVFVSPLLVYYFHRLSTLAVFSNLLIVPLSSGAILLLFVSLVVGTFSAACAQVIGSAASIIINVVVAIAQWFADIPLSTLACSVSPIFLFPVYFMFTRLRTIACYITVSMAIVVSLSSLSHCLVVQATHDTAVISMPCGTTVVAAQRLSLPSLAYMLHGSAAAVDYVIASRPGACDCRQFIGLPEPLSRKRIQLGDVILDVAETTTVQYHDMTVVLDTVALSMPRDRVVYLITNGEDVIRYSEVLYGSIIDRMISDARRTSMKCVLLFRSF